MSFYHWEKIKEKSPKPGVKMKVVYGEKGMMVLFEIDPHVEIEIHNHPHEQMGTVLEGEIVLIINEKEKLLKKGDVYIAKANIPHGAYTLDKKAKVLDFFSPPREEYKDQDIGG